MRRLAEGGDQAGGGQRHRRRRRRRWWLPPPLSLPLSSPLPLPLLLLLLAAVAARAAPFPAAQNLGGACPSAPDPVCADDGATTYLNACVAAFAGARIGGRGRCAGSPLRFAGEGDGAGGGGGATDAAGTAGGSFSSSPPSWASAREAAFVGGGAAVSAQTMLRFAGEGFRYVGRVPLAPRPTAEEAAAAAGGEGGDKGGGGGGGGGSSGNGSDNNNRRPPRPPAFFPGAGEQLAVRFTPEGHLYVASVSGGALAGAAEAPPTPPEGAAAAAAAAASGELASSAAARFPPLPTENNHARGLRAVVGPDGRGACGTIYPFTAVGELIFDDAPPPARRGRSGGGGRGGGGGGGAGGQACSGALVKDDRVLTAAHCVWNARQGSLASGSAFVPGLYRDPTSGRAVQPFGSARWETVTLLDGGGDDAAVVALDRRVGRQAGTLGVRACGAGAGPGAGERRAGPDRQTLYAVGYPVDRPPGTCAVSACDVILACGLDQATKHACDTGPGQSGAPMIDASNYVRGVHVGAVQGLGINEFVTLTAPMAARIAAW